jgi:SPP1 family phage portal protein
MSVFEKSFGTKKVNNTSFGRKELVAPYEESDLTQDIVGEILKGVLPTHIQNVMEINYLKGVYRGLHDILGKVKKVRPDINNKSVVNNAFHIVEFKKGYVFGDPIQYVQRSETQKEELDLFNKYMYKNSKSSKDKDLAEDFYTSGVGYRIALPSDKLPFEIFNLDNTNTGIVYSNNIQKSKLVAFYLTYLGEDKYKVMCYTKFYVYNYHVAISKKKDDDVKIEYISTDINPLGKIPIVEYKLNKSRLGLVELIKSMIDALNFITSSDLDDIEQFVQSLLVFVNQEVDKKTLIELLEVGALQIFSTDPKKPADVKILSNKMQHSETKVLYDRIYSDMLTIAGVPKMSDKASSGDTGQAKLVGEGWTMADERAKQDELSFKESDKEIIELCLDICKVKTTSGIKTLSLDDIEIKFTRNRSDNMLVKTQALMNLQSAQVAPEVAFSVIGLFSDPAEVVTQSKAYYGDDFWKIDSEIESEVNSIVE